MTNDKFVVDRAQPIFHLAVFTFFLISDKIGGV